MPNHNEQPPQTHHSHVRLFHGLRRCGNAEHSYHYRRRLHLQRLAGVRWGECENASYPIRSVSDGEWRYIRNLAPDRIYLEKHLMGKTDNNPYWPSWIYMASEDPNSLKLVERFLRRPDEELYHTSEDHFEMNNLADAAEHLTVKTRLAAALDQLLKDQGDPGLPLDTEKAHRAAVKNKPLFPINP